MERIADHLLKALPECIHVLRLHRESGRIHVSSELLQKIAASTNGIVYIEAFHAASTTAHIAVAFSEHHGGPVVLPDQARGNNADHALVPDGIEDHCTPGFPQEADLNQKVPALPR